MSSPFSVNSGDTSLLDTCNNIEDCPVESSLLPNFCLDNWNKCQCKDIDECSLGIYTCGLNGKWSKAQTI